MGWNVETLALWAIGTVCFVAACFAALMAFAVVDHERQQERDGDE